MKIHWKYKRAIGDTTDDVAMFSIDSDEEQFYFNKCIKTFHKCKKLTLCRLFRSFRLMKY